MSEPELMSVREAARCLATRHDLSRPRVTRLLQTGIAGPGVRAGGALLHDAAAVRRLAAREVIALAEIAEWGLAGLIVTRRAVNLLESPEGVERQCTQGWDISVYTRVWLRWVIEQHGPLPMVVTAAGFVLAGAEVTGFAAARGPGARGPRMVVREPGRWFEELREARVMTGPGAPFRFIEMGCARVIRPRSPRPPAPAAGGGSAPPRR